jgi:type II secretory pathway pseudopilin PulG
MVGLRFDKYDRAARWRSRRNADRGFTYVVLLFAIVLFGLGSVAFANYWSEGHRRDIERELFRVGEEITLAIGSYYESSPGSVKQYPRSLRQLAEDDRFVGVRRHLRRVYADPVTRENRWGLVQAPDGGIVGVHSLSEQKALRQSGYPRWIKVSGSGGRYVDLQFVYVPVQAR